MDEDKRGILKGLALGTVWSAPVVSGIVLPAHAITTGFSLTLEVDPCASGPAEGPLPPVIMNFPTTSTPSGDGTLSVTAQWDLGSDDEFIDVFVEGSNIGQVGPNGNNPPQSPEEDNAPASAVLTIPRSVLASAAENGTISISFAPNAEVDCFDIPDLVWRIEATLNFPA